MDPTENIASTSTHPTAQWIWKDSGKTTGRNLWPSRKSFCPKESIHIYQICTRDLNQIFCLVNGRSVSIWLYPLLYNYLPGSKDANWHYAWLQLELWAKRTKNWWPDKQTTLFMGSKWTCFVMYNVWDPRQLVLLTESWMFRDKKCIFTLCKGQHMPNHRRFSQPFLLFWWELMCSNYTHFHVIFRFATEWLPPFWAPFVGEKFRHKVVILATYRSLYIRCALCRANVLKFVCFLSKWKNKPNTSDRNASMVKQQN